MGREEIVYYPECQDPSLKTIRIADGQHLVESHYDNIFNQYSKQNEVFEFVRGKYSSIKLTLLNRQRAGSASGIQLDHLRLWPNRLGQDLHNVWASLG